MGVAGFCSHCGKEYFVAPAVCSLRESSERNPDRSWTSTQMPRIARRFTRDYELAALKY
jgi:hypothetical protein